MSDKSFSTVQTLLGFNSANGSTTFTDEGNSAKTYTAGGNAQCSTARFKYGTASLLLDGTGDYITSTTAGLDMDSMIYTVEGWAYLNAANYTPSAGQFGRTIWCNWNGQAAGRISYNVGSTGGISIAEQAANGVSSLTANSAAGVIPQQRWFHWAISRDLTTTAGVLRGFVDGVLVCSATGVAARSDYGNRQNVGTFTGATGGGAGFDNWWLGNIDEVRLSFGACRYTEGFRPPQGPFSRAKRTGTANQFGQSTISVYR